MVCAIAMCVRVLKKHCCCCCRGVCCIPFPRCVLLMQVEREVAKDEKLLASELKSEVQGIESVFSKVLGIFKR